MLKRMLLVGVALSLSACGTLSCIDTHIKRKPRSIERKFEFTFQLHGGELIRYSLSCEKYYDAMCAERGNFWTEREVGKQSGYEHSYIAFPHPSLGTVELELPTCMDVVPGRPYPLNYIFLKVSGETYSYVKSVGDKHTYRKFIPSIKPPAAEIELEFELRLNGKRIEPS